MAGEHAAPDARCVRVEMPASVAYLSMARMVVIAAAGLPDGPGFDDSRVDDLRLVLSEAITNAVKANAKTGAADVAIDVTVDGDALEVTVADRGPGIDPSFLSEVPSLHDIDEIGGEGGLGIPLMRALCDKVEFATRPDGGTEVRLMLHR